ncbi:MAG: ParB/RepB/Spo0J family partition protein [Acidobacteria bacterium]|jgi:ParB family chromosome partitioning protein|nr:ParB/RepB/Spo0J family partition protein [Acidobacteriota bacterium]
MSRKVLGRGINALLNNEDNNNRNGELLEIDLDLIEPNSEQPRTNFSEESLDNLAQSIRANGIVQPIVVRQRGSRFEIVAGERRWRASQKIGLQKIPAVVKSIANEKLLELALIENIQRQELNAIEEAKAYKNLIEKVGLTQEMIAERVGKNRTAITTFLRLLKLPDDIQKLLEEEKITAGHARALLMSEDKNFQRSLAKKIIEMSLSVRETEKAIKRFGKEDTLKTDRKKMAGQKDANVKSAETKLRRQLGTQVQILPDGKGTGGKIEIEYYSNSDLERIYQVLMSKKQ